MKVSKEKFNSTVHRKFSELHRDIDAFQNKVITHTELEEGVEELKKGLEVLLRKVKECTKKRHLYVV